MHFYKQICERMEKLLDRAPAMGYEICNFDDDMVQSVLDQQEWNTIWREEEQPCNNQEDIVGGGESVENSNDDGATNQRCSYQNEEENIKH